jgi:hypothetical protein
MKSMQCSVEEECKLSTCSMITKIMEKLYEVSVKLRYTIHTFNTASKNTRAAPPPLQRPSAQCYVSKILSCCIL